MRSAADRAFPVGGRPRRVDSGFEDVAIYLS